MPIGRASFLCRLFLSLSYSISPFARHPSPYRGVQYIEYYTRPTLTTTALWLCSTAPDRSSLFSPLTQSFGLSLSPCFSSMIFNLNSCCFGGRCHHHHAPGCLCHSRMAIPLPFSFSVLRASPSSWPNGRACVMVTTNRDWPPTFGVLLVASVQMYLRDA